MERKTAIYHRKGNFGKNGLVISTNIPFNSLPGTEVAHQKD
jgi:hypothetical protein